MLQCTLQKSALSFSFFVLTAVLVAGSCLPGFSQVADPAREMSYDQDSKTAYVVFSAGQTLYVHLEIADPVQQRKVIQNGLELWIDMKGKKNKKTGIGFPLPGKERAFTPSGGGGDKADETMRKLSVRNALEPVLTQKKEMMLTGFTDGVNGMQPVHLRDSFEVLLRFKNDTLLVYDAAIPFTVFARPFSAHTPISIGIVEKGLLPPGFGEGGGMHGESGGAPGGGENGPPGGGAGGPPGGGAPPGGGDPFGNGGPPNGMSPGEAEMQRAIRDDVFWFKYAFSQNMRTAQ